MKKIGIAAIMIAMMGFSLQAQEKDTAINRQIIESQNYVFTARTASPMRGGFRQLTPEYDLVVKKDSIISWLPYFGRAYSASINTTEGGLKFTSTKFEYTSEKQNSHRWEVTIKPKDASEVEALTMTLFDNGTATLRVNSTNRDGISFNGYITAGKAEDKKAF